MTQLHPPAPPESWTKVHKEGDTIEGVVSYREIHFSKVTDSNFEVLGILGDDNTLYEVMCGRVGLRKILEQHDPQPGDRVALTFWGERDSRFIYTSAISKAPDNRTESRQIEPVPNWDVPPEDSYA